MHAGRVELLQRRDGERFAIEEEVGLHEPVAVLGLEAREEHLHFRRGFGDQVAQLALQLRARLVLARRFGRERTRGKESGEDQ
ncbi:hypothetical protein ASNO1_19370 [Corallococcus caeni]|uniref:Uncharacterized protein n=1 Tax=Corallococcus caeni TaxID=3082388 RepID=A0ABQ6QPU2_9BACT|nr:hypothetical protein ASNO1_19370 [Corallococcus sp. NO1]